VVAHRRPQVLRDRQQLAASVVQVSHGPHYLVPLLAQPQDQVRLCHKASVAGARQHLERSPVPERRADALEDPRHRFEVVSEDFRTGGEHQR
jgi:hypothetical protein